MVVEKENKIPLLEIKQADDLSSYCSKTNVEWLERFSKMVFLGIEEKMESVPLIDVSLDGQRRYRIKLLEKDYIKSLKNLLPVFEKLEDYEKCKKIKDIINKTK